MMEARIHQKIMELKLQYPKINKRDVLEIIRDKLEEHTIYSIRLNNKSKRFQRCSMDDFYYILALFELDLHTTGLIRFFDDKMMQDALEKQEEKEYQKYVNYSFDRIENS